MITILIGPRATGKTTIGRLLAGRLGVEFADLDDRALAKLRETSVRQAWQVHGEAGWRRAETGAFEEIRLEWGPNDKMIIALGGGAPTVVAIRDQIHELRASHRARVVYLRCAVNELASRLKAAPGDRPSITGQDVSEEVAQLLAQREATYLALADVIIDTGARTAQESMEELRLRLSGPGTEKQA